MNRVIYLSSWSLFSQEGRVQVPFIYEQIGALSFQCQAIYFEVKFIEYYRWVLLPASKKIYRIKNDYWSEYNVNHYILVIPKISTRLTNRETYEDLYWASKKVSKLVRQVIGKIDLIHCHTVLDQGAFAFGLSKHLNVPLLYQEHSAPFEMHLDDDKKKEIVAKIIDHAKAIVAVGPFLAKRMIQFSPSIKKKIQVIPEMINTDVFKLEPNDFDIRRPKLISIGALVERKGYQYLIRAVNKLIITGIDIHLTIIGEGNYRNELEEIISNLKLQHRVILTGHLEKEQISEQIKKSNLYVHSSLRETFGIAPTEALLMGRPVVSTRCEGPEYYINDSNGILVNKESVDELIVGIEKVINNWSNYDGEVLRRSVEKKFGKVAFLQQMTELYEQTINK
ncbi:MAG: glycosyltransferase [Fulvivirga sp.]|uniref:glycosyltransferase n=1 Tax=Fulvivirga sp. TaxID=1931237 RepID=UPI0032EC8B73